MGLADPQHPPSGAPDFSAGEPDSPRARFRRYLRATGSDVPRLREHLLRAVPQIDTDREARLAVEEIVSHLGALLGFNPSRDETEDADIWTSPTGVTLVVRVMSGLGVPARLQALTQARDRRLAGSGEPARTLSALGVVCGSRIDWRQIEDAVAVRRALDSVRLVSVDALLALSVLREDHVLAHPDAVVLLRPQDARADALIELMAARGQGREEEPVDRAGDGAWWIK
jgi:hypothetical protein